MKVSDVPDKAWSAKPTPIPTKVVYDWDAMMSVIKKQGFVIIESDQVRVTKLGGEECVPVKAFNAYVRITKGRQLKTKRLTKSRWFCTL